MSFFVVNFTATQHDNFKFKNCNIKPPLLWTITQLLTVAVTWQHGALVVFPPTQVDLNTVKVIMLFL